MAEFEPVTLGCLGTGDPKLDAVLGGGIPAPSTIVVAGEPGSGKTTLALQVLFHQARAGRKAVYFTTLSEPSIKLLRYMQQFEFFDPVLLPGRISLVDLGSTIRKSGAEAALSEIGTWIEREEPALIAVDSFKAIHDLMPAEASARLFVYDLAVQTASWGATTLLVGEYPERSFDELPEFAVADGIIRLSVERTGLTALRRLEVRKMRGAAFVSGQHFFEVSRGGIEFHPRVAMPSETDSAEQEPEVLPTGVPGLDEMLGGGLPSLGTTLVEGGSGTGKTLIALRFLLTGAARGEPGLFLAFEETPGQLRWTARRLGWDLTRAEADSLLAIHYRPPVELNTDALLDTVLDRVDRLRVRRVALDGLASLAAGSSSPQRFRELVYALGKHLRARNVALLMTAEVPELLGNAQLTGRGVSSIADSVIILRYLESGGELRRALVVLKARGVAHDRSLRELIIDESGPRVAGAYSGMRGVLTGVPAPLVSTE